MTDAGSAAIIATLAQAGKLSIDPKGAVTYTLEEV
jgi:VCBS repeat-containing protein